VGLGRRIVTNAEGDDAVLGEGTFGRVLQGIKGDVQPVVRPMHSCRDAQADSCTCNCCCMFLSLHVTTRSYPWRLSPPHQTPDAVIKQIIVIPDRPPLDMFCAAQAIKTMVRTGDSSTEEVFIREIAMLKCAFRDCASVIYTVLLSCNDNEGCLGDRHVCVHTHGLIGWKFRPHEEEHGSNGGPRDAGTSAATATSCNFTAPACRATGCSWSQSLWRCGNVLSSLHCVAVSMTLYHAAAAVVR